MVVERVTHQAQLQVQLLPRVFLVQPLLRPAHRLSLPIHDQATIQSTHQKIQASYPAQAHQFQLAHPVRVLNPAPTPKA